MATIKHKPFWTTERRSHNAFGFPRDEVDIAIIGGGLKGLATMYFLSQYNLRCIILERGTLGCGESSRNIGAVCTVPDCSPNTHSEDVIIERVRLAEKSRDMLKELIHEISYDADLVCNGGVHLAANETQVAQLEVLHGLLVKNGIVCDELDHKQVADLVAGKFTAGLYYPGEATINPSKLLDLLIAINGTFVNNSAVEYFTVDHIEETDDGVDIMSDEGMLVKARTAVICTDNLTHFYTDPAELFGPETASLCFTTSPIEKVAGKIPMTARTVTGIQAWSIQDGRLIYSFRGRPTQGGNFGYNDDDIRKAQRFLTQYVPFSKGHYYQEYIWSSNYRKPMSLLPFTRLAPGSNKVVLNAGYGYSVLDLFLAGAERAAKRVKDVLTQESLGGVEGAEPAPARDPEE